MGLVELGVVEVSKSNRESLTKPKEGLCPNHDSCKNYMSEAYDCNVRRNLGLNSRTHTFPCYSQMDSFQRV